MPRSRPDEGLEGGTLGVDAQRHSFPLLVLCYEVMDELFALPDREQAVIVAVAEVAVGGRFKVPRVHAPTGHRVAALAHARVVAQTALVQVGVGEGVAARDPFGRIKHQHTTQQVHGLVGRPVRQHV